MLNGLVSIESVPFDNCDGVPISHGVNICLAYCLNRVLNVKALVNAFNQENALVGATSVIVKTDSETDGLSAAL